MHIFTWFRKTPHNSLKDALIASRLKALQQNIKDALRFLRKNYLKTIFFRQKLPWYILLGAENTGKTNLLVMSGLDLVSTNNLAVQTTTSTTYCQWFFGKEAVFIDTAGSLMLPEHTDTSTLNLWKKFVTLLYRYRHFHPLNGLILCIDLLKFQDKSFEQQRHYIDILRHHIHAFSYPIPIYLIFTRCDRVQGFTEFFHTLHHDEREQVCGISLSPVDQQDFATYLEEQFNAFLLRLNEQMIARLQSERNLEKRLRIKNFPLQLEAQKRMVVQLNSQLHSTRTPIKGIYFTSSQQEGAQSDALSPLLDTFGFPEESNNSDRSLKKNAYFIKNTLKKIIQQGNSTLPLQKNRWQKILHHSNFYWILSVFFLAGLLCILPSYFYNRNAIYHIATILIDYEQQKTPKTDTLSLLNALQKSKNEVKNPVNPFSDVVFPQAQHLKSQLNVLYVKALNNIYTPRLQKTLEMQIQADISQKSPTLFHTLKLYLMMGNPSYRDLDFIHAWFTEYAQQAFKGNPENQHLFLEHLKIWLAQPSTTFKIDPKLVSLARQALNNLPPSNLVYANLEAKYRALNTTNITALSQQLYLEKNFNAIYEKDISSLSTQIVKNDAWVLEDGPALPDSLTRPLISQLTHEVQQLYVTYYTHFWIERLANLNIPSFEDLNEARLFAITFNTPHSLLLEPLKVIQTNLAPIAATPEGQKALTQLEKTRELLTNHQLNKEAAKAVQGMVTYLDGILKSKNVDYAIFVETQKRMQEQEEKDAITQLITVSTTTPLPVAHWLKQLADNTWKTMLHISQNHLNALWKKDVLPKYYAQILNRYPVFNDPSLEDIRLTDFITFFGPSGAMDSFFKQNLHAFVDTSTLYWQWKKRDGVHLDIPQSTLEMFNRASIIRKMYFPDNEKQLSVKFSLAPTNVDLISSNLILSLDGQLLNYAADFRQPKQIGWPNKKPGHTALDLQEEGKRKVFYEEKGDWAVFRLLAHATLYTSHNPKLYELEFNLNNQKITYELLANTAINAFIPDILTAVRCPDRL